MTAPTSLILIGAIAVISVIAAFWFQSYRSQLKRVLAENAHLKSLIDRDDLTDAHSRRYLVDRVGGDDLKGPNAILFIDLDDFKSVNDGYGHEVGDALLIEISRNLVSACRPGDFVSRLGGDEFCVFLAGCTVSEGEKSAARFSEAVRQATVQANGFTVSRSASIGVADIAPGQPLVDALLNADDALYLAKSAGRNQVQSEVKRAGASADQPTVEQVSAGLENDEFEYFVQPIFDTITHEVLGVEALLRWIRPDGTVLEPIDFMNTITENYHLNMKPPLKAANEVASIFTGKGSDRFCAFNISSSFLARNAGESVHWIDELLNGLKPEATVFEIVENAVIKNPTSTARLMSALQAAGVRVALDDFGVGHSNLGRLRRYSVDIVKIDKSFVSEIATSDRDLGILLGMAEMSRSMGFEIIAEGVETTAQLEALKLAGITKAQGFLLGRPAPARDWAERLGI